MTCLRPFAELATGTREGFAVRAIASSDFSVFIEAAPVVAAAIATAIERLVALYKQLLEIRKLRAELAKHVPAAATTQIADYTEGVIASKVPEMADQLVLEYYKSDDQGRTNELKIAVRHALLGIAIRIDRGFNIQVTANPPPPHSEGEDAEEPQRVLERTAFERIQAASETTKFIKAEGEPLLKLESKTENREVTPPARSSQ